MDDGLMSAELMDPFATHEPNLTPDEWLAIWDEINDRPWEDPTRYQELLQEALKTLGEIGTGNSANPARDATQSLRRMVYRAHNGVPYGEAQEPDWSLDTRSDFVWHKTEIRKVNDVVEDL